MQKKTKISLRYSACLLMLSLACGIGQAQTNNNDEALKAAKRGDTKQLVKLFEYGVSPDTVDTHGNTPLMLATMESNTETVKALLKFHPNLSARNAAGDSALMIAALKGDKGIFDLLLDAGGQINHIGWTPLMYAALEGHLDIVETLLSHGADVNALSPNESNALMLASRNGHIAIVRRLLKTDININQVNDRGMSADSWAASNGNTDIAELIQAERKKRGLPGVPAAAGTNPAVDAGTSSPRPMPMNMTPTNAAPAKPTILIKTE